MNRGLLDLLSAVSLLAWVAVVALWARSYWHQDYLFWSTVSDDGTTIMSRAVHSSAGRLWLDWNWTVQSAWQAVVEDRDRRVLRARGVRHAPAW